MVPMEYEAGRTPYNTIGWTDPRTEDGDLAWPARFSPEAVAHWEDFVIETVLRTVDAKGVRALLGDGNFGGYYERSDEEMDALWAVAVEETRTIIDSNWA